MIAKRRRRRGGRRDRNQMAQEALARAKANISEANYPLIAAGFKAKGIPEADILPRENVFTFWAWKAKGRSVRRGEHGVKVPTYVEYEREKKDDQGGEPKVEKGRARGMATVFHVSQTCELGDRQPPGEPTPDVDRIPRPTPNLVARFRELADAMDGPIAHAERPLSQRWTRKRGSQLSSRLCDASNMRSTQRALRALANAHERGDVPNELAGVRTKGEVAALVYRSITTTPDSGGSWYPTYVLETEYADKSPAGLALQQLGERPPRDERADRMFQLQDKIRRTEIDGFFPTPLDLAKEMIAEAQIQPGDEVLEPSAGMGDLVLVALMTEPTAKVVAIERVPLLVEYLNALGEAWDGRLEIYQADFLTAAGEVDRIVMNPPYERGQDIEHVRHAYGLLKPGGRLVALMSEGAFYRSDRKAREFVDWFDGLAHANLVRCNRRISNAFKGRVAFRETGVAVRLIVLEK